MTASEAILWSERLACLAVFFQTIELLQVRKCFADSGVWSWSTLRQDYPRFVQGVLSPVFSYRGFLVLLVLRAICAGILLASPEIAFASTLLIFVTASSLLVCWRWRGTYNGGSDFMTMVVLLALSVVLVLPQWTKIGLGYIAVQLGLSYFLPGIVKLKKKEWRSGSALLLLMKSGGNYEIPQAVKNWVARPNTAFVLAWGLIAFELSFPIAMINSLFCEVYLAVALLFHLVTFYVFGLNRFVWAWIAAFPALLYWSSSRG
jgi:hypothetical protein